ncbi:MAG: ABC transporter substrate-binding protein [Lachnospiraceae bacterium]|nr:ABC transporter substrate-binding protein [Lachnospiraceae bacterium]
MKNKIIGLFGASLLAAGIFAGYGKVEAAEADAVKISASDANVNWFQVVDEIQGFSKELGLDVEWVENLGSGPEIIAAIAGGSVDVGKIGDFPIVTNYGGGETPVFEVLSFFTRNTDSVVFVKADSEIESIEDLKGKKIGTQIGTGSQYQLVNTLDKAGLTLEDVELFNVDSGSWAAAFASDEIDAVCILEDVTIGNEEIGDIRVLDRCDLALNSIIGNTEWAAANPEATAKTIILLSECIDYASANVEDTISAVAEVYPEISAERLSFSINAVTNTALSGDWDTAINRYTELKDFALDAGTIQNDFDVESVYDPQFVELANTLK